MSGHQPDAPAPEVGAAPAGPVDEEAPDAVESGPPGTFFSEIRFFSRLDSTNRYLVDVARRRPQPGLVAVADHQSAGRGRLGRTWEAPPGANLLASVLLAPILPLEQLHLCSAAVSLAAAEACAGVAGVDVSLKWPNDLVVADRKLAGVLAETVPSRDARGISPDARLVVVGVGINVRWPPPDGGAGAAPVPDELRATATSIVRESGRDVAPTQLLTHLLVALDPRVRAL
jgi:BirA family transcriptional regulator, biotin operon repressor / biotin---[acetyl-CoA-carboxylase] ligase